MYNILRQVIPLINNAYKEGVLVAVANSCFYIKFIVMIGSSLITLSELEKSLEMEVYLIQKLSYSIELKITTLYVSLMFTTLVSDSDLH